MTSVGLVVIGRNEGERLKACLQSVSSYWDRTVYVDSGSSDGSQEYARALGVMVEDLDMSIPFTAARARNAGLARLQTLHPDIDFVQFIDGDCVLESSWLDDGRWFLEKNTSFAAACGHVTEMYPEASLYHRLLNIEWRKPIGESEACGGVAIYRKNALFEVNGFNPEIVAGEEPELCQRLRSNGWRIMRLDVPMARHDSAMYQFSQWWKRSVRGGYGGLAVYRMSRGNKFRPFAKQIMSARFWVLLWPLIVLCLCSFGSYLWGNIGLFLGSLLGVSILVAHLIRIVIRRFRQGDPVIFCVQYALMLSIAKLPELLGQMRFTFERVLRKPQSLIEHKS